MYLKVFFRQKALLHRLHRNGISPVWFLFKINFLRAIFQLYALSFVPITYNSLYNNTDKITFSNQNNFDYPSNKYFILKLGNTVMGFRGQIFIFSTNYPSHTRLVKITDNYIFAIGYNIPYSHADLQTS